MIRLTRSLFAIALGLGLVAGSARASQVVFGNLGSDGSVALDENGDVTTAARWFAQGFTTGPSQTGWFVDSIMLGLEARVSPVSTTISIWESSGSAPSSELYSSEALSVSASGKYTFTFNDVALSATNSYWVVLKQGDLEWAYNEDLTPPTGLNSSGFTYVNSRRTTNSGTSWGNAPSQSYAISITASSTGPAPVPEPGTWAAAALLIGAAAYARWRRRPQTV